MGLTTKDLWKHQRDIIDEAQAKLDNGQSPLIPGPTAVGKTLIGCELVNREFLRGDKVVWFMGHRHEIVEQNSDLLMATACRMGLSLPARRHRLIESSSVRSAHCAIVIIPCRRRIRSFGTRPTICRQEHGQKSTQHIQAPNTSG